jgi:hypothetical protein
LDCFRRKGSYYQCIVVSATAAQDTRRREQIDNHLIEVVQFANLELKHASEAERPAARARLKDALRALTNHVGERSLR